MLHIPGKAIERLHSNRMILQNQEMGRYLDLLHHEILNHFHCLAVHVATRNVCQDIEGHGFWEGDVEVFSLIKCPAARICFALGERRNGEWKAMLVTRDGKVKTADQAVKTHLDLLAQASH